MREEGEEERRGPPSTSAMPTAMGGRGRGRGMGRGGLSKVFSCKSQWSLGETGGEVGEGAVSRGRGGLHLNPHHFEPVHLPVGSGGSVQSEEGTTSGGGAATGEDNDSLNDHPQTPSHLGVERRLSFLPPHVVVEGTANRSKQLCITLDKRSWLEVYDKRHRYGKNLRVYYKEWNRLHRPGGTFFGWLDTSGVELPDCDRQTLENDTVQYLSTDEERRKYELVIQGTHVSALCDGSPVDTGEEGWICVIRNGSMFAARKRTVPPRLHHSSFYGGQYVEAAGMLLVTNGTLKVVYPHSGHYRPNELHTMRMLEFLHEHGTDLNEIDVDAQRVFRLSRPEASNNPGAKARKLDCPYILNARDVLDFLTVKHKAWSSGLFDELHVITSHKGDALLSGGRSNSYFF